MLVAPKGNWINAYHLMQLNISDAEWISCGSFEQLWLKTVMKYKYKKWWNQSKRIWKEL
jgi:hypothetical protein